MTAAAAKDERLLPGTEVSRELWLLCGNQCAFPGCGRALLNEHDDFEGEIAHIHGVKPKSARYLASMSAEEKRAAGNLLLLCPNHHGVVDGAHGRATYSADSLRAMKKKHEERFRRALAAVEQSIGDVTRANVVIPAASLDLFVSGMSFADEEPDAFAAEFLPLVNDLAGIVGRLTQPARELLAWLVTQEEMVGLAEAADRLALSKPRVRELMEQLKRFELADIGPRDNKPPNGPASSPLLVATEWAAHTEPYRAYRWPELLRKWPGFWLDVQEHFAGRADGATVEDMIVGLDFSLLDHRRSK